MSIVYNNKEFSFISHEKLVDEIYSNVYDCLENKNKSHKIKKELFYINKPYKVKEDVRKKKSSTPVALHQDYAKFVNEVSHVKELFNRFLLEFLGDKELLQTETQCNLDAIRMANEVYVQSERNPVSNAFGGNNDRNAVTVNINNARYLIPSNCQFYCHNVTEMEKLLNQHKYDLILLDPPWWNKFIRRKRFKTGHGYKMLYNAELKELPVEKLLNPNGLVVVWCTNSPQHYLYLTNEIFPKWKVKLVGKWYWIKVIKRILFFLNI